MCEVWWSGKCKVLVWDWRKMEAVSLHIFPRNSRINNQGRETTSPRQPLAGDSVPEDPASGEHDGKSPTLKQQHWASLGQKWVSGSCTSCKQAKQNIIQQNKQKKDNNKIANVYLGSLTSSRRAATGGGTEGLLWLKVSAWDRLRLSQSEIMLKDLDTYSSKMTNKGPSRTKPVL